MSELLSEEQINDFIRGGYHQYYTSFSIPKGKSRRRRKLQAPNDALRNMQRKLLKQVLYPNLLHFCHPASIGFMPRLSCKDAAQRHTNCNYVIQMDIEDFFTNTTLIQLDRCLMPLMRNDLPLLGKGKINYHGVLALTTVMDPKTGKWYLPQGAPTSPFLSNIAFRLADADLDRYIPSVNPDIYTYTRYADDLTFSTNHARIIKHLIKGVTKIVKRYGYSINTRKTRITKPNKQQKVLGITVNEKVSVPRKIRRELRAALHKSAAYNTKLPPRIIGMLAWVYSVNPQQYARLMNRLTYDIERYRRVNHG